MRSLLWFRKGLRLHDNAALVAAGVGNVSSIVPVFVLDAWHCDPENVGDIRFEFIMQSLRDLDSNLRSKGFKSGLIFVRGEPENVLPKVWEKLGCTRLCFDDSEEAEVHDRQRDTLIKELANSSSVQVSVGQSHWLHPLNSYEKALGGGAIPQTMTQFQKLFAKCGPVPAPIPAPDKVPYEGESIATALDALRLELDVASLNVPDESFNEKVGRTKPTLRFAGGETAGLARLKAQIEDRPRWAASFEKPKTSPNSLLPDTTVVSPYLTHGCLSARLFWSTLHEACKRAGPSVKQSKPPVSLDGQLLWREHWYSISWFSGTNVSRMKGSTISRQIPWDYDGPDAAEKLQRWTEGRTGFPFIDAIMTQLRREGWIHHLARHATACFATRGDLWLPWDRCQKVFDKYLIDADWSINACNWMWLSCSAFFYQYFRCYSPVSFGKKTDPTGAYIRKYLPQLKNFPDKFIYEPHLAPLSVQKAAGCIIGEDYPKPMVANHTATSKEHMSRIAIAYKPYQEGKSAPPASESQKKRPLGSSKIKKEAESKRFKAFFKK